MNLTSMISHPASGWLAALAVIGCGPPPVSQPAGPPPGARGEPLRRPSATARLHEPPVFIIDHPFFYAIRDNRSGGLVFGGRVLNPAAAEIGEPL